MSIHEEIKNILAEKPSFWITREQTEAIADAHQNFVEQESSYCLGCDGIHVGAYRTRVNGERPDPGETCNGPHVPECTCDQCEYERQEAWEAGGAESIVMLHHSPKSQGDGMTLENALRGSGDLGAFLACCWGTKLQDPDNPYQSASFLSNLKQRDFESEDFEASCGADCRMHIVGNPELRTVVLQSRRGNKGNKDGLDSAAEDAIRAHMGLSVPKLHEHLLSLGIERGTTWIQKRRAKIKYGNT